MKYALVILFAVLMISSFGCGEKDTYRPVYYPDKDNLSVYTRGPKFDNLAQARQWANDQHGQRRNVNWTYEIGKNCKPFEDSDIEICEETLM